MALAGEREDDVAKTPLAGERAAVLALAESHYHRRKQLELAQTRVWGVVAVAAGVIGAGAALLLATSSAWKALVPMVAALIAVVAAFIAAHERLRRGRAARRARSPRSLGRIGNALAAQRRDARASASAVWRDA
jgi:uncharacterized membrane protein YfcA